MMRPVDQVSSQLRASALSFIPAFIVVVGTYAYAGLITVKSTASYISPYGYDLLPVSIVCLISFAGLTTSIFSQRRGFIDLIFWCFHTFFFAWPAVIQAATGRFPWGSAHGPEFTASGSVIVAAFLLCYLLGSLLPFRTSAPKPIRTERLVPLASVLIVIATAMALTVGPGNLLATRLEIALLLSDKGQAYPYLIGKGASLCALIILLDAGIKHGELRTRGWWFAVCAATLTVALWFYPAANPRFQALAPVLMVVSLLASRLAVFGKSVVAAMFLLTLVFAFGAFKGVGSGQKFTLQSAEDISNYIVRVDFDPFQQTIAAVKYVDRNGYMWGSNFSGAALFFVPRPIWPSKPEHSGAIVSRDLGYTYNNVAASLVSEFYLAGGLVVVSIGAFVLGRSVVTLDVMNRAASLLGRISPFGFIYALVASYEVILLRGSLGSIAPMIGLAFFFIFGCIWLMRSVGISRPRMTVRPAPIQ